MLDLGLGQAGVAVVLQVVGSRGLGDHALDIGSGVVALFLGWGGKDWFDNILR